MPRRRRRLIETIVADEGLDGARLARRAGESRVPRGQRRAVMPICRQLFISDPAGATGIDLDRKVFVARKRIEHELPMEQQTYFPSLSSRTLLYKGMLTTPQLGSVLPRPRRRAVRERAGPGAQPVQHQHVPVVAAGPPVSLHRPQRRDQHRAGQPQLDAHTRVDAGQRSAAGTRAGLPDLHARWQRLGDVRRGARTAAPRWAQPAARDVDDDPRGVGEPRHDGRRRKRAFYRFHSSLDGAVGRARPAWRSPTAP